MLPEKIVFAVDIGPECAERCGSSSSMNRLTAARQTIKRFIQLKRWMSPMHEFAIMTFAHTTFWHCEFGQSPDQLDKAVDEIHQADYETADYYDLLSLFEAV
ncbi:hypothetical protein DFJ73DRAFT_514309 [Zopfochytrium polystomum]|nr:hypothetical protein DFJ73DRAFT_514309 [Zopfochytrium polystomum]